MQGRIGKGRLTRGVFAAFLTLTYPTKDLPYSIASLHESFNLN